MLVRPKHVSTISSGKVADAGTLWCVNVNTAGAGGILKIYNDQSAVAANIVAILDCATAGSFWYGVYCDKGIFYDLSVAACDVTIGYA